MCRYRHYKDLLPSVSSEWPTVVISNKYETEWGGEPVNFLSVKVLDSLFGNLTKHKFRVVYNRAASALSDDHQSNLDLGDGSLIGAWTEKEPRNLFDMRRIVQTNGVPYNEAQLRIFARVKCFISVQGGTSLLSSYFGGENVIFYKKGGEKRYAYENTYPKLSNAQISVVEDYESLSAKVAQWIESPSLCKYDN
jgi:hypothetical protein